MKFSEAKPFLKDGMKIKIIDIPDMCHWYDDGKWEKQEFNIKDINEEGFDCIFGPIIHTDDEIEILENPDGTPCILINKKLPCLRLGIG